MTKERLKNFYWLSQSIKSLEFRLQELRAKMYPSGMNVDGMPRSPTPSNKVEVIIPQVIELERLLESKRQEYIAEAIEIQTYLNTISDLQVKLSLEMRYVYCLSWRRIAQKIGGGNTEDSIRKLCMRYIERSEH